MISPSGKCSDFTKAPNRRHKDNKRAATTLAQPTTPVVGTYKVKADFNLIQLPTVSVLVCVRLLRQPLVQNSLVYFRLFWIASCFLICVRS